MSSVTLNKRRAATSQDTTGVTSQGSREAGTKLLQRDSPHEATAGGGWVVRHQNPVSAGEQKSNSNSSNDFSGKYCLENRAGMVHSNHQHVGMVHTNHQQNDKARLQTPNHVGKFC